MVGQSIVAGPVGIRVRVCISTHKRSAGEVVDRLETAGFPCEEDTTVTSAHLGPAEADLTSHWIVAVALPGGHAIALASAEHLVAAALKNLGPTVSIRGSWVVEQELVPNLTFFPHVPVSDDLAGPRRWWAWLLVMVGQADLGESIRVHSEDHAEAEYERRSKIPGGPRRTPGTQLRRSTFNPPRSRAASAPGRRRTRSVVNADITRTAVGLTLPFLAAFLTQDAWKNSAWGALLLAAFLASGIGLYVGFLRLVRKTGPSGLPPAVGEAAFISGTGILVGIASALMSPGLFPGQLLMVILALILAGNGLRLLIAAPWAKKAGLALVPIALSLFPPLTHQISQLSYAMYLGAFSLSPADSQVTWGWQGAAGPIAAGSVGVLAGLAIAGYARHWHVEIGLFLLIPVTFFFATGVLSAAAGGATAGTKAQHQATQGHLPKSWNGLNAAAVCVYPLTGKIAYTGAPPVIGRPVLSFNLEATQVALWDPRSGTVTHLPAASAALRTVPALTGHCPTTSN